MLCQDVDHIIDILNPAFHQYPGMSENLPPLFFEEIRQNHDIANSCFIFHAHEENALGRAGTLAHDHISRDSNDAPIGDGREPGGGYDVHRVHFSSPVCHGMFADGHADAAAVRYQTLFETHLP